MKNLPVAIRGTNKLPCLVEIVCLGVLQSLITEFREAKDIKQSEQLREEASMFRKSSAVPFLLWLLVVSFFNQIEGNNPVSSNSSKVSLLI